MAEGSHITPDGKVREHELSRDCWCKPKLTVIPGTDNYRVTHNGGEAALVASTYTGRRGRA